MKKKKRALSDSELRLILLLLAVLLLAATYFFVYSKSVAAAQELEAQNAIDSATVKTLESMIDRREQVEAETEALRQSIQDIIAKYPADLTTEKSIDILQNIENFTNVEISNVSFLMGVLLMDFTYPAEETNIPPTGYYSALSMGYTASYDGYKEMLDYMSRLQDRMIAPAVSATYDGVSDMVSGNITVNLYYLQNTGKEYVAPVTSGIDKGVESIFGAGEGITDQTEGEEDEDIDDTENAEDQT